MFFLGPVWKISGSRIRIRILIYTDLHHLLKISWHCPFKLKWQHTGNLEQDTGTLFYQEVDFLKLSNDFISGYLARLFGLFIWDLTVDISIGNITCRCQFSGKRFKGVVVLSCESNYIFVLQLQFEIFDLVLEVFNLRF